MRYLRSWLQGASFFPLDIRFRKVRSSDDYLKVRDGVQELLAGARRQVGHGYRVELEARATRSYGRQSFPVRIAFEDEADYLAYLGKEEEAAAFKEAAAMIRERVPALRGWVARHPKKIVAHLGSWPDLLRVVRYFQENPRPEQYLRELPVSVPTKFIEAHQGILRSLLDAVLPDEAVRRKEDGFERRYFLRQAEPLVRLRLLDEGMQDRLGWPSDDLSMPAPAFARLDMRGKRMVVTENKMTFLTLPALPDGLGLFGRGFQVEVLKQAGWLHDCTLLYWGDLDAQGFQILSQLRSTFPRVQSVMMDRATLEAFRRFAVPGTPCPAESLPHLAAEEQALFEYLCANNLRLEQERISQAYAVDRLRQAAGDKREGGRENGRRGEGE